MSKIRSVNTKPELKVRKILFKNGFRYRLHANLPGKPDIVLSKYKTIIFVNGCFWHGHTCKYGSGYRKPKTNEDYWKEKINKNIKRDKNNVQILIKNGWKIITIWECELKDDSIMRQKLRPLFQAKNVN